MDPPIEESDFIRLFMGREVFYVFAGALAQHPALRGTLLHAATNLFRRYPDRDIRLWPLFRAAFFVRILKDDNPDILQHEPQLQEAMSDLSSRLTYRRHLHMPGFAYHQINPARELVKHLDELIHHIDQQLKP